MKGEIISSTEVAIDIKEIEVKLDREIRFIPGQYVMLAFEDKSKERRAYSILSYDKDTNVIVLLIKYSREFTHKLLHMKPGEIIYVYGPYGKFTLKGNDKNIFIAGGIGIVPLYSMLNDLVDRNFGTGYLFYNCRTYKEMALHDESLRFNAGDFQVKMYFTREGNMDRFNAEEIKSIGSYLEYSFYICGPDIMMGHIANSLRAIGIEEKNIHTESFSLDNQE